MTSKSPCVAAASEFASPASPVDYALLPIQTLKVGSLGTHKALGLAKEKCARFLLTSTSEVYGDPLVHPQTEDYWGNVNTIGPRGCYDESKRFAQAIIDTMCNVAGARIIVLSQGRRRRRRNRRQSDAARRRFQYSRISKNSVRAV